MVIKRSFFPLILFGCPLFFIYIMEWVCVCEREMCIVYVSLEYQNRAVNFINFPFKLSIFLFLQPIEICFLISSFDFAKESPNLSF